MVIRKKLETDACPSSAELEAHARKTLYGRRNEEIFLHLKQCAKCLRRMAKLSQLPSAEEIIQGAQRPPWWQRWLRWGRKRPSAAKKDP